jgi:hypothetical protein
LQRQQPWPPWRNDLPLLLPLLLLAGQTPLLLPGQWLPGRPQLSLPLQHWRHHTPLPPFQQHCKRRLQLPRQLHDGWRPSPIPQQQQPTRQLQLLPAAPQLCHTSQPRVLQPEQPPWPRLPLRPHRWRCRMMRRQQPPQTQQRLRL